MATYTRKHFELAARALRESAPAPGMPDAWRAGCDAAREYIARTLADAYSADNSRFDRSRFYAAAEVSTL